MSGRWNQEPPSSLLLRTNRMGRYASPGYLLFGRDDTLMAQSFDVERLALTGEPTLVAEGVRSNSGGWTAFSTSRRGHLAYVGSEGYVARSQLRWVDRSGGDLGAVGMPDVYQNPALSPDEGQIAVQRGGDLWLLNLSRGTDERFTLDAQPDVNPVWSPDGQHLVFAVDRRPAGGRSSDLYKKETGGASPAQVLLESDVRLEPSHWSSDGAFLLRIPLKLNTDSGDRERRFRRR